MNERHSVEPRDSFEERSRALFLESADGLDFALRSRLTQARAIDDRAYPIVTGRPALPKRSGRTAVIDR